MESNSYGSVRMGDYDISLRPSATNDPGYELPRLIRAYQMNPAGSREGTGILTAPTVRLLP